MILHVLTGILETRHLDKRIFGSMLGYYCETFTQVGMLDVSLERSVALLYLGHTLRCRSPYALVSSKLAALRQYRCLPKCMDPPKSGTLAPCSLRHTEARASEWLYDFGSTDVTRW